MTRALATRLAVVTVAIGGCGGDVPATPTYFADVQPILRANCARCHGADPIDSKNDFRLDRYVKGDDLSFDAWDYAQEANGAAPMIRVAVDQESPAMPPDFALSERQQQILARWVDQGAPKGTRDNHLPEVALLEPTTAATVDQSLDLVINSTDADLDGLVIALWAHDVATGDAFDVPIGAPVGGGRRRVTVDTGQLASKHTFELYAYADDGYEDDPALNRTRISLLSSLVVDHGARGTAPTVRLLTPNGGETLIGAATITWTAQDPDPGDVLTIDLKLIGVNDNAETTIASGVANTGSYAWTIPTSVPTTQPYRVRVTATDTGAKNTRSDDSDGAVSIARPTTTTLTWADVKPIFVTYCLKCHGQPAKFPAIEYFRMDKYNAADPEAPTNGDQGVFEVKGLVYQKMIVDRSMPPAAEPNPPQGDLDKVKNWIEGGAPEGGGPANQRPTFVWDAPSATVSTQPTTLTLTWHAADVEGLASGKLEYAQRTAGMPATGCTAANTATLTWSPIADPKATATLAGALVWMDTLSWTVPALSPPTGYFCVRGTVTDDAGQTTTTVNAYGIK